MIRELWRGIANAAERRRRRGSRSRTSLTGPEALEGRDVPTGGVTPQSLLVMAANVASARAALGLAPFQKPVFEPTLRVSSVALGARAGRAVISFQNAAGGGLNPASLPGNVTLIRTSAPAGVLPTTLIGQPTSVLTSYKGINAGPNTATPTIGTVYDFGQAIPAGRYLLHIDGAVQDLAGRHLDGNFDGRLPSGDGVPGGSFNAVFVTNGFATYTPKPVGPAVAAALAGRRALA